MTGNARKNGEYINDLLTNVRELLKYSSISVNKTDVMEGFTKEQVKTFMWLAYQAGKSAGRIEAASEMNELSKRQIFYFKNWYESIESKVRQDYSIFEDFPFGGITSPLTSEDGGEWVEPSK